MPERKGLEQAMTRTVLDTFAFADGKVVLGRLGGPRVAWPGGVAAGAA